MSRAERIKDQLGMPAGTANGKLRKSIMFDMARRLGDDVCYRCSKKIEAIDEFSIEHKKPWEGIDSNLFWSLDNIAFSHMKCNREAQRYVGGVSKKKIGPEGTSWCSGHKDFLPVDQFCSNKSTLSGLHPECRECQKKYKDSVRHK